jgi:hypothetical protein
MLRKWRWLIIGLVVLLVASVVGYFVFRDDRESQTIAAGNGVVMTVEADLGSGKLTHELLAKPPLPIPFARPLSQVVRLGVQGGGLNGSARVSFTVPKVTVPAGMRMEEMVFIARRADTPDARWEEAGGTYDASSNTIWTDTTHFSDWVLSMIDAGVIDRNVRIKRKAASNYLTKQLGETLVGKYAPPACTDPATIRQRQLARLILVPVRIFDPAQPQLEVCMGYMTRTDPALGGPGYYLEIFNAHDFPLVMDLPTSVVKLDEPNPDTTYFRDLYRLVTEDKDEARFQPREKRAFKVEQPELVSQYRLRGDLDFTTFLVDLSLALIDFSSSEDPPETAEAKRGLLSKAEVVKDGLICMYKVAELHVAEVRNLKDKATWGKVATIAKEVVNECFGPLLDSLNFALQRSDLSQRVKDTGRVLVGFFKSATKLFLGSPDIADALREFMTVNSHSWSNAAGAFGGDYRPEIDLRPYLANLSRALPPPNGMFVDPEGGDPRRLMPGAKASDLSAVSACATAGVARPLNNWFVRSGTILTGVANYDLFSWEAQAVLASGTFVVAQVEDAYQAPMANYIRATKMDCSTGEFRYITVPGLTVDAGVAAKWQWLIRSETDNGIFIIRASRGKWLIQAHIIPSGLVRMSSMQMRPFINEVMTAVFQYLNATTGTQFAQQ